MLIPVFGYTPPNRSGSVVVTAMMQEWTMPWRCPACRTNIRSAAGRERPALNTVYRCPVCRLALVFDEASDRLTLAPLDEGRREHRPIEELLPERRRRPRA